MFYTYSTVFPVLAMVEDESPPPAYAPIRFVDDAGSEPQDLANQPKILSDVPADSVHIPVTSSFRRIAKTIHASGGWSANFRGIACLFVQAIATSLILALFSPISRINRSPVGKIGSLIASLALVQLSTAWVHIVISKSGAAFWRRLPPFRVAFKAAARPIFLNWLCQIVQVALLYGVAMALNLQLTPVEKDGPPVLDKDTVWKSLIVVLVSFLSNILLVVPSHVILVRVQASLLPSDIDTIVPFDRSFQGAVQSVAEGGKGYLTITEAWKTFSRAALRRLIILYVKIFGVCVAIFTGMAILSIPLTFLLSKIAN
jgi:hypothetical protein